MDKQFLVLDGHIINVAQIAHASDIDGEDAVHVDMIGGGFHRIAGLSVEGLASLLNGAVF